MVSIFHNYKPKTTLSQIHHQTILSNTLLAYFYTLVYLTLLGFFFSSSISQVKGSQLITFA